MTNKKLIIFVILGPLILANLSMVFLYSIDFTSLFGETIYARLPMFNNILRHADHVNFLLVLNFFMIFQPFLWLYIFWFAVNEKAAIERLKTDFKTVSSKVKLVFSIMLCGVMFYFLHGTEFSSTDSHAKFLFTNWLWFYMINTVLSFATFGAGFAGLKMLAFALFNDKN